MFQFFDSFLSEKKPNPNSLNRTHHLEEITPPSCQTAVKNHNKPLNLNFRHTSHSNDQINFPKTHQNSHKSISKCQFFTATSEIELDGHKYKLLKICSDGQFIGNLMDKGNQFISKECHFAVVKKVSGNCQNHHTGFESVDGFESVNGDRGKADMNLCQNIKATQENQSNEELECIVFELKFEKTIKSPVHILLKSRFLSLFDFYLLNCVKRQRETTSINGRNEIKSLMMTIQKYFNNTECSILLMEDGIGEKQEDQSINTEEKGLKDWKSYEYKFGSEQDLLGIKFFIVDRLKKLIAERQSIKTLSRQMIEGKNKEMWNQKVYLKQEKSQIKILDKVSEKQQVNELQFSESQINQSQVNKILTNTPLTLNNTHKQTQLEGQTIVAKQNYQQIQKTNKQQQRLTQKQQEELFPQTNQQNSYHQYRINDTPFMKQELVSLCQIQSQSMIEDEVCPNIQKGLTGQMQCEIMEKKQSERWKAQNAITYVNLPAGGIEKQKLQDGHTLSNEKTIPEKLNESQKLSIQDSQVHNHTFQQFKLQQDSELHSIQNEQNSAMVDEQLEGLEGSLPIQGPDLVDNTKQNISFELTTVNKPQTILQHSFSIPQFSNYQEINKESQAIIPKKLTFENNRANSQSQELIDNMKQNYSLDIENYKIDEQMEQEIGGYESQDFSQEHQSSLSQASESISVDQPSLQILQSIKPMEPQIQNFSPGIDFHNNSPIKHLPMKIEKSQSNSKNHLNEAPLNYHHLEIDPIPPNHHLQENYDAVTEVIKTRKLINPNQPHPIQHSLTAQLKALEDTEFIKSTYTLTNSTQKSLLCLQILKEQGKVHKPVNGPKSKEDLIKLIVYNPIILQNDKYPPSHSHNKFINIKAFRQALHKIDKLQVSSDEQRVLLYSTKENSHPVVIQYSINTQRFTSMFKIPSLCYKSGLIKRPLPLIKVQYLNDSGDSFCAMTSKEICIFSRNAHKYSLNNSEHYYHKVFVYRNIFADKISNEYEFDTFQLHENGRYLVVGLNGRFIRVFDLQKQQQDQIKSNLYQNNYKNRNQNYTNPQNRKNHTRKKFTKNILCQQTTTKTKIIRRLKNKTKPFKPIAHNHENFKIFYLKSLNSFDLENDQNVSPLSSKQKITLMKHQNDQHEAECKLKIKTIKLIHSDTTNEQKNQKQTEKKYKKVEKIYCERDDGRNFLINCLEETITMGTVSCFERKLRLNKRSLIRVVTGDESKLFLEKP